MIEHGPDKALVSARARGQVRAKGSVRAAVAEAGPAVRRYLFALGATWDEAEDLAQGALLKAWRARAGFDGRADVRTWIFSIARNHWRDEIRRRGADRTEQGTTGQEQMIDPSVSGVHPHIKPRPVVAVPDPPKTPLEAAARSEGLCCDPSRETLFADRCCRTLQSIGDSSDTLVCTVCRRHSLASASAALLSGAPLQPLCGFCGTPMRPWNPFGTEHGALPGSLDIG